MALIELPDDATKHIASFLEAPDVLSFLNCHSRIHALSNNEGFWYSLMEEHLGEEKIKKSCVKEAKEAYLTKSYTCHLPELEWKLIATDRNSPSGREGHVCCQLGRNLVITGGFVDDEGVYVLPLDENNKTGWKRLSPTTRGNFVYGASLTPLDENRAVQFGGFRGGGYSMECSQVAVLTFTDVRQETAVATEELTEEASSGAATVPMQREDSKSPSPSVSWVRIETRNDNPIENSRAYHTATLLCGRYLLVLGGMKSSHSIMREAILDTETWTWLESPVSSSVLDDDVPHPSGRHGHSVVLDHRRDRLVLFGGGSGSDLLRSGTDNAEVWELKMGHNWRTDLTGSLPWTWRRLHEDFPDEEDYEDDEDYEEEGEDDDDEENEVEEEAEQDDDQQNATTDDMQVEGEGNASTDTNQRTTARDDSNHLTTQEKLCLGRCHIGVQVSPGKVLLAFGSGRPSTNGVIAYCLESDSFFRPKIRGPLPTPRLTGVASMIGDSYLFFHGGYSTQENHSIREMAVLDLAPALKRSFNYLRVNHEAQSYDLPAFDRMRRSPNQNMIEEWLFAQLSGPQPVAALLHGLIVRGGYAAVHRMGSDSGDDQPSDEDSEYEYDQFDGEDIAHSDEECQTCDEECDEESID